MNKENCAITLVDEIILYYDARSKKHQIACLNSIIQICVFKKEFYNNAVLKLSNYDYCYFANSTAKRHSLMPTITTMLIRRRLCYQLGVSRLRLKFVSGSQHNLTSATFISSRLNYSSLLSKKKHAKPETKFNSKYRYSLF